VAAAQLGGASVTVRTDPAVPLQGGVAWLVVRPSAEEAGDSVTAVEGEAAGEMLHFVRGREGLVALVAAPLVPMLRRSRARRAVR
jgi:hypothetical protein